MSDQFELFHLSLHPRPQADMFAEVITREQWLRDAFGREHRFGHHGIDFHYVPDASAADRTVIVGRIGRQVVLDENRPPDEGLQEITRDTWRAAVLLIDPTHHDEGQRVAFQRIPTVGKPVTIFPSLVDAINQAMPHGGYTVQAMPLLEEQDFWAFVEANRGRVTSLTFEFVAPNMFDSEEAYEQDMRDFKEQEKIRTLTLTLENKDGLEPDTPRTRKMTEYAAKGQGRIKARAGRKRFDSNRKVKQTRIDEFVEAGKNLVRVVTNLAKQILDRE